MKQILPAGVVASATLMGCWAMTDRSSSTDETLHPEALFVEVEPRTKAVLLADWRWKVGQEAEIFRATIFGDLFLEDVEGRLYFLDTGSARYVEVAESRDDWAEAVEIHGSEWFHLDVLRELRALGVALQDGDVYSWRQYPMLGGLESVENVDVISLMVHVSHSGRVAESLQDLGSGAQVGSVDFNVLGSREGDLTTDAEGDDRTVYEVVINEELQYSIWPAGRDLPSGWRTVGKSGAKEECLRYISEVWTDMRPRSLREQQREDGH